MTYRQIARICDQIAKRDRYEALQMARGKMPAMLRPDYSLAAIMGIA